MIMAVIGIDSHKDVLTGCLVDASGVSIEQRSIANTTAGHAELVAWARSAGVQRVGIEGAGNYGRPATVALIGAGVPVVEVPPQMTAAARRRRRTRTKTDPVDEITSHLRDRQITVQHQRNRISLKLLREPPPSPPRQPVLFRHSHDSPPNRGVKPTGGCSIPGRTISWELLTVACECDMKFHQSKYDVNMNVIHQIEEGGCADQTARWREDELVGARQ